MKDCSNREMVEFPGVMLSRIRTALPFLGYTLPIFVL